MKKLFLILAVLVTVASCNTSNKVTAFVNKHCHEVHVVDVGTGNIQVQFQCDSLYDSKEVKTVCGKSIVCFDVSQGIVTGELVCGNKETTIKDTLIKLLSKIKFW